MSSTKQHLTTARNLGVAIIATVGLAACATYDDEFATINSRLDQLDSRVQSAAQSASFRSAAQAAGSLFAANGYRCTWASTGVINSLVS